MSKVFHMSIKRQIRRLEKVESRLNKLLAGKTVRIVWHKSEFLKGRNATIKSVSIGGGYTLNKIKLFLHNVDGKSGNRKLKSVYESSLSAVVILK